MAIGVKGIQSERLRRRQEQQDSVTNGHVEREEPRLFTERALGERQVRGGTE